MVNLCFRKIEKPISGSQDQKKKNRRPDDSGKGLFQIQAEIGQVFSENKFDEGGGGQN